MMASQFGLRLNPILIFGGLNTPKTLNPEPSALEALSG